MILTLHHFPFCPFSRWTRMALSEHGVAFDLVEERPWERREEYLRFNPAGTLPTLVDEDGRSICGAGVIAEFLDETLGSRLGAHRLLPEGPLERAETRRLIAWFDQTFHAEAGGPLLLERAYKLQMPREAGGGPPDAGAIRTARAKARAHLAYVDRLVRERDWIAGETLSFADLAAAGHLSCVDYFGDLPWAEAIAAKDWYARLKSRPSFRPFLAETVRGSPPAPHYADLDF